MQILEFIRKRKNFSEANIAHSSYFPIMESEISPFNPAEMRPLVKGITVITCRAHHAHNLSGYVIF